MPQSRGLVNKWLGGDAAVAAAAAAAAVAAVAAALGVPAMVVATTARP